MEPRAAKPLTGSVQGAPVAAESSALRDQCIDLYGLWQRYESHSTFHNGQKARADYALECDCAHGRFASGLGELKRMLRRGRVPIPGEN